MTGANLLQAILDILLGSFTEIGSTMGSALSAFADGIMITTPTSGTATLSTFAIVVICFASISLGLALFRWVLNVFTSFGQRNR